MTRKLSAVLAASDHGPMIVSRLDYQSSDEGKSFTGVGCQVLGLGAHDAGEIEMLAGLLEARRKSKGAGVVVVDGGANIGTHAISLGKLMTDWGSLMAFEPQERIFFMLAGNVALNNVWNVRPFWAALGNRDGALALPEIDYDQPRNFGGISFKQDGVRMAAAPTVALLRLDRFNLKRLDLLKLDVEGMEIDALAGAALTIERCRPIVFFEHALCGLENGRRAIPRDYVVHDLGGYALCFHESDEVGHTIKFKTKEDEAA